MYKKLNNKKVELNPCCPGRFGEGKPRDKISIEREFVLFHRNLNLVLREKDIPKASFKDLLEGAFVQRTKRCQK